MTGYDKEFVKENHLDEARRRFNQIVEYTFITKPSIDENDDELEEPQDGDNVAQNNQGGDGEQQKSPQQDGQDGNNAPTGDVDSDGGEQPSGDDLPDFDETNVDTEQEGDEVIDVDDLTKAQETTDYKLDGVDNKINNLIKTVSLFTKAIENNDKKIEDLKAEFEKRNPSEEEKLNIRSQASYPYSETPKDFWDKKQQNDPRYNVMYNNDVPTAKEQEEFVIRNSDVNNVNDKAVSDSFDLKDEQLKDYLNF